MSAVDCCDPQIDPCVWEKHVPTHANSGGYTYLRVARRKAVREVYDEIVAVVCENTDWGVKLPDDCDEYLSPMCPGREWPEGRIVVYAVNGSSEGDYVHVAVVDDVGKVETMILGKTFAGRDAAWRFARRLADLLGV